MRIQVYFLVATLLLASCIFPPYKYVVDFGYGGKTYVSGCGFEGFTDDNGNYGVFAVQPGDDLTEGTKIEGDLAGDGTRRVHDADSNRDVTVEVRYHIRGDYQKFRDTLRQLRCLK